MNELDKFLIFLMENTDDDRINIWKKMKYGYRHYYISLHIDQEKEDSTGNISSTFNRYGDRILISIDNRNNCIEVEDSNDDNIIIEDTDMVNKWSKILDEFLNRDVEEKISNIIEETLSSCARKDLHRDYKMKKIFKDDEPI